MEKIWNVRDERALTIIISADRLMCDCFSASMFMWKQIRNTNTCIKRIINAKHQKLVLIEQIMIAEPQWNISINEATISMNFEEKKHSKIATINITRRDFFLVTGEWNRFGFDRWKKRILNIHQICVSRELKRLFNRKIRKPKSKSFIYVYCQCLPTSIHHNE